MDMSTQQIDEALFYNPSTAKYFLGTFASDTMPESPTPGTCFVSNTDPIAQPGQHWVAFYVSLLGKIFYFDPLGLPPLVINHIAFCTNSADGLLHYNTKQLQKETAKTCGAHCIKFLIHTCQTGDPKTYLQKWRNLPTAMTERSVMQYVKKSEFHFPLRKV